MTAIITLITDFGTADGFVGAMKGRILSMNPQVRIVDITHEIEPQNVRQASWCLKRAAVQYPAETVHVVVVDPGVGSERGAALLRCRNQWFVGPDNGVFSEVIREAGIEKGYRLHNETRWWKKHRSFDGLALFAPAAACLSNGIDAQTLGDEWRDFHILDNPKPVVADTDVTGEIICFDRFGNAMTTIGESDLARLRGRSTVAVVGDVRFVMVDHYQAGTEEAGIAVINSDGRLELSVCRASARERFALRIGDAVQVPASFAELNRY